MIIGNKEFEVKQHTYVMGILNVTPDSFSDGGKFHQLDKALYHVQEMIEEGAHIIDVGGESTRPGHIQITDEEEIHRIVPIIKEIKSRFDIPVSLDTYKGTVAKAGVEAGIDLINDIWGLQYDDIIGGVVAESELPYCLMHNRTNPVEMKTAQDYLKQMEDDVNRALQLGVKKEQIILDPGVGFAKTQEENLLTISNIGVLHQIGCPILLGTSRKSVMDYVLHLPVDQRLEGTLATTAVAVMENVAFVRVHDVKENVRFIQMLERLKEKKER